MPPAATAPDEQPAPGAANEAARELRGAEGAGRTEAARGGRHDAVNWRLAAFGGRQSW